jgi:hypothetical protein
MITIYQKIIFILFIMLSQFLPDILSFLKSTWLINYINFFWFDKIIGGMVMIVGLYIAYLSFLELWPYMKNNFPFNL